MITLLTPSSRCIQSDSGLYPGCNQGCIWDVSEVQQVYLGCIQCIQALTYISCRGLVAFGHPGDSSSQISTPPAIPRLHPRYTQIHPQIHVHAIYGMPICHMTYVVCLNMSDQLKMPQNGLICHNCAISGVRVQCVSRVCPGVYPRCIHWCS